MVDCDEGIGFRYVGRKGPDLKPLFFSRCLSTGESLGLLPHPVNEDLLTGDRSMLCIDSVPTLSPRKA